MAIIAMGVKAQIVTSNPPILTQSSTNMVLTYHPDAADSNGQLANLPSSTQLYAHIGLITNKSTSGSDWKYAPTWLTNDDKYKLTYVSTNTYTLTISDFKSYFGLADGEVIESIAMVFRDATGSKEGKTKSGGDIYLDVFEDGYQMLFTASTSAAVAAVGDEVTFNIATTEKSAIKLSVNGQQLKSVSDAQLSYTYKFASVAEYNFTATATSASGASITKEIFITVPSASKAGTYPGGTPKMGTVRNADGTVTFCLAAPGKNSVVLVPSWDDYRVLDKNVMAYQDYNGNRYFWITVSGLDYDTPYPYYYLVDGSTAVADPYARLVLDCYSDKFLDYTVWPDCPKYPYDKVDGIMLAVYQGNLDGGNYKFTDFTIPEHRNLVIYEMLFRDFTGTEGKALGNGTVKQAIEKIPYLVELGVNAVELMPIMEFNGNNSWGYNTNFYFAPDKAYGSPLDYKHFIETCHRHGIAVILDIVFNQSDGLHPWYQMYPIESNPFYNKNAPHDYSVLNDWKQDNPLVQQQWTDVIKFWMEEYNVDGFRFDLVKGLGDNNSYGSGTEAYNQSRIDRMKRLHGVIKSVKPNGIHINEHLAGSSEETQMANDGQLLWANFNHNACQFAMGFSEDSNGGKLNQMYDGYSRPAGSIVAYAESHDEERVGYKINAYGQTQVKSTATACKRMGALAAQLLLAPGPKMIWQFGELGANQTTKKGGNNNTDPKTVIWSRLDNTNYKGLHDTYKALCNLRNDNFDLFGTGVSYTTTGMGGGMSTPRTIVVSNGTKEVVAFINANYSGSAMTISARASQLSASNSQLICATTGTTPSLTGNSSNLTVSLAPNSMAVFATTNVAGVDEVVADLDAPAFEVYGGNGEIVIVGEYNHAQAYTLTGQPVGLTNLAKGIYIVQVDGSGHKVAVK